MSDLVGLQEVAFPRETHFTSFWLVTTGVNWGIGASIPKLPARACKRDTVCVCLSISWEHEVQAGQF